MSDASTERVLARYLLQPKTRVKTAALSPYPPTAENGGSGAEPGSSARNIPKDHDFQARALKPLSKALWASTVALGHTLTAYRHLSRLKSATVSPDGLMGGRGYVMKLAEMRQKLYEASEALSAISDTIFDEINGPHWKPKLAQLDESDKEDVTRFIEEAQDVMENPEADAEDEIEEIENAKPKDRSKKDEIGGVEDDSSSLPRGDAFQGESVSQKAPRPKEASTKVRPCGMSDRQWVMEFYSDPTRLASAALNPAALVQAIYVKANSSQPVSDMPGGPRVDHLGPGTGDGEYGDFSEAETMAPPADDWNADGAGISRRDPQGEDYDYSSEWENDLSRSAGSWRDPINLPSLDEIDRYPGGHGPAVTMDHYRQIAELLGKGWQDARILNSYMGKKLQLTEEDLNNARHMKRKGLLASANIPDSSTDDTPTDAMDFGIGYGARGQGSGGYGNPSGEGFSDGVGGKGVWGPHSGLPGSPPQSTGDSTHLVIDDATNRHAARLALYGKLPQDVAGDVARSDYYSGSKDNMVSVGTSAVPTPDALMNESGQGLMNTNYTVEDPRTDYERYDHSTRTLREPGGDFPGQNHQEPFAPDGEATR